MRRCQVFWSRQVEKQLDRSPHYIRDKFAAWAVAVERLGLREVRKLSGYHDEPLKGKRKGQRSIRLSRSYRAIYVESDNGEIKIVEVLEVSKHDY
jgi:proteic killer suppression protein